ncbi:MAG TPA: methylisocitrate lyase [Nitrospirales bacterium]
MPERPASKSRKLRELIAQRLVVMPGAFNALVAIQIERAGFDALYISGAAMAAARGLPDIGLLSMTEVRSEAQLIATAVRIPALADADTGYGPPLSVMRTTRELEVAGVAGIQLEDQEAPKKCGHLSDKKLVTASEMARTIAAAVQARHDPDFLIVARTDARSVEGLKAAVLRARLYVEAGADVVFPEALESAEEFRAFARMLAGDGVKVPLVANMTEFGKTPYLTAREFEDLGYRLILFPVTLLRVATKAMEEMLMELKALGTQRESLDKMHTRQQLYELLRYNEYEQQDAKLRERYGPDR